MKLPLSKRLQACASFIRPGDRVADIGCDHGYLGIHLLMNNIASSVISADVRSMPLNTAIKNAKKYGTSDRMEFYLSDGLDKVPQNFSVLVCAGMGADTILSVLNAAPWLKTDRYRLILQCQSRTPMLRHYLSENGWHILREEVLRDGHFLYTVIEAVWKPELARLSPGQWFISPALLNCRSNELSEFYQYQCFRLRRIIEGRKAQADPLILSALAELEGLPKQPDLMWLTEVKYDYS